MIFIFLLFIIVIYFFFKKLSLKLFWIIFFLRTIRLPNVKVLKNYAKQGKFVRFFFLRFILKKRSFNKKFLKFLKFSKRDFKKKLKPKRTKKIMKQSFLKEFKFLIKVKKKNLVKLITNLFFFHLTCKDVVQKEVKPHLNIAFLLDEISKLTSSLLMRNVCFFWNFYENYSWRSRFFVTSIHPDSTLKVRERFYLYRVLNRLFDYYNWVLSFIDFWKYAYENKNTNNSFLNVAKQNCYWSENSKYLISKSMLQNILYAYYKKYSIFNLQIFSTSSKLYIFLYREFYRRRFLGNNFIYLYLNLAYEQNLLRLFLENAITPFFRWNDIHITWTQHKILLYRKQSLRKYVEENTPKNIHLQRNKYLIDDFKVTRIGKFRIKKVGKLKFQAAVA